MRFTTATLVILLLPALIWLRPDAASPVPVRFVEGAIHGFLVLKTDNGVVLASGDLRQTSTSKGVEANTVFNFKDGSLSEETVVFTRQRAFSLQTYHLLQRGPAFAQDIDISMEPPSGKYHVKAKAHKDGKETLYDGMLDLPTDVYNGMISVIAKNLPKGANYTVHFVAFTPEPRVVQLEITPAGQQKVMVGGVAKSATDYVLHPQLGTWLKFFAKLSGRMPPDNHIWILADPVPAFVRFEGQFYMSGPVWRLELTSPNLS